MRIPWTVSRLTTETGGDLPPRVLPDPGAAPWQKQPVRHEQAAPLPRPLVGDVRDRLLPGPALAPEGEVEPVV